jgi:hypothetical protein
LVDVSFQGSNPCGVGYVFCVIRDDALVFCVEEFDYSVDKVAQVVEELGIVFGDEFAPEELGVGTFWSGGKEVVTEYGGRDPGEISLIAKYSDSSGFRELVALVL